MRADLDESTADFEDEFIESLQKSVSDIKQNRRMEERYMLTELIMQDERRAGRIEGRRESLLELLGEIGEIPKSLQETILQENDLNRLSAWLKLAMKADSMEQFEENM